MSVGSATAVVCACSLYHMHRMWALYHTRRVSVFAIVSVAVSFYMVFGWGIVCVLVSLRADARGPNVVQQWITF